MIRILRVASFGK